MNSLMYTTHPDEFEVLFTEGTPVTVLGVDEVNFREDDFADPFMRFFNNKKLNIVCLFHTVKRIKHKEIVYNQTIFWFEDSGIESKFFIFLGFWTH